MNPYHLLVFSLLIFLGRQEIRLISPHKIIDEAQNLNENKIISVSEHISRNLLDEQQTQNSILKTVRLYGDSTLGYYYINLFFGSQYHKASLIVDTGSTITAIPCKSCGRNCGTNHFNPFFDTSASLTYKEMKNGDFLGNYHCNSRECSFGISYTEGSSYSGYYGKDFVAFGNELEDFLNLPNNSRMDSSDSVTKIFSSFGCITRETKLFYSQQADGILGLGIATDGIFSIKFKFKVWDHPPTFIQSLHKLNHNNSEEFSICYALNGGYLTVGGYNTAYHVQNQKPAFVNYHTEHGQYRVTLKRIDFEGTNLGISEGTLNYGQGAFFDSGTTLMYTVRETYNSIMDHLNEFCKQPGKCGSRSNERNCFVRDPKKQTLLEFLQSFPTMTFHFGDDQSHPYELRGEDYMYAQTTGGAKYCVGIEMFNDRTILGGTFMRNHDILFDKEKGILGFVRANCSAVSYTSNPEYIPGIIDSISNSKKNNNDHDHDHENDKKSDNVPSSIKAIDYSWLLNILIVFGISGGIIIIYLCARSKNNHNHTQRIYDQEVPQEIKHEEIVDQSIFQIEDDDENDGNQIEIRASNTTDSTIQTFN